MTTEKQDLDLASISSLTDLASLASIHKSIDCCTIRCTPYDIAQILRKILKGHYRYIGKNKWEYWQNNQWQLDKQNKQLRDFVHTYLSDMFLKRYMYIFEHRAAYSDYIYISTNLLKVSYKLKTKQFISAVIKEARSFFDFQDDD